MGGIRGVPAEREREKGESTCVDFTYSIIEESFFPR